MFPSTPSRDTLASDSSPSSVENGMCYPEAKVEQVHQCGVLSDPLIIRPLLISLAALPFLCFLWSFFVISSIEPIVLPEYFVTFVRRHMQSTTMISSTTAFVLSTFIFLIFSFALRYAIGIRLATGPASPDVLTAVTRIAQRTLWIHDLRAIWTWIVLTAFVCICIQTPALSAFLSVRELEIRYSVVGNDLNMADPRLLEHLRNTSFSDIMNTPEAPVLSSVMVKAIELRRNVTRTVDYKDYRYIGTTGGIQPVKYVPTHNETEFGVVIPADNTRNDPSKHVYLPFNKTMQLAQQGFTADVNCRIGDPEDLEKYHPTLSTQLLAANNLSTVSLTATCPSLTTAGPAIYDASDVQSSGAVLGVACQIPNTDSYDIIISSLGVYDSIDQTTCTITPKTTLLDVRYFNSAENPLAPTTIIVSPPKAEAEVPAWGKIVVDILLYNFVAGQSNFGNTIGNVLLGAFEADLTPSRGMNDYFKTAVELTGTMIRHLWTQPDSPFTQSELGDSSRASIQGVFVPWTLGWRQDYSNSPLLLVPPTVTILSIYGLLIYGLVLTHKHRGHFKEEADFSPSNVARAIAGHTLQVKPHTKSSG